MNEGVKLEDDAEAVLSPSSNRVDPINDRPPTIEYDVSMTRPDDGSVLFSDYKTDSYVILDPSSGYSLASSVSISTKEADGTRKAQVTIDEQAKDTAGEATGGGRKRVKATNKNERPEKELPEGVRRCKNQFVRTTKER
jgi:streptogramin lyase